MKSVLCFGDSNTWGLIPKTNERYPWGVRWTSILQEKLTGQDIRVIEEGLCGRTTVFEDAYRDNRNGLKSLSLILESHTPVEYAVIMLGTNDCKSYFNLSAFQIAKGVEKCVDKVLSYVSADNIILVSPIALGEDVWKTEFDPEFNKKSVEVSHQLEREYKKIADKKQVNFISASEYAKPSEKDQEHLTEEGHAALADAVFNSLSLLH